MRDILQLGFTAAHLNKQNLRAATDFSIIEETNCKYHLNTQRKSLSDLTVLESGPKYDRISIPQLNLYHQHL